MILFWIIIFHILCRIFIPIWYEKKSGTNSPKKKRFNSKALHKGVRRLETATESRSRDVQGRVVRTSIVVAPGGSTVRAAAAPTARANTVASSPQGTPDMAGMKLLYKGMKKIKFF
jgi:hypothetical protein